MINYLRKKLLKFSLWLDGKIKNHKDYSKNDPEWIEMENESTSIINRLRKEIE